MLAFRSSVRAFATLATLLLVATSAVALAARPALALPAPQRCTDGTGGTWVPGELNIWWFDVEQGDSQLIVGPTGRTLLIDLGETAWNRTSGTAAQRVAAEIQAICGLTSPVLLDYVMGSHLHLDHIGYAGNTTDGFTYGNGLYELLHPDRLGFGVGALLTRDGGTWVDSDGNGACDVGTAAEPSADVVWHHAGTVSQTARRWICWLYGPDGQRDRAMIEGKVVTITNEDPWPTIDLGPGVDAAILQANAKGVMQADGVTPVSGDHTTEATPPSENDYSVAVRVAYGEYEYATAGDADGEYNTSSFGYTYNDVEAGLGPLFGDVETMRVNHHGSGHSTSNAYTTALAPETAVISCGNNSYGHPAVRVTDELAQVVTDDGVGADVYMTNNPCDADIGTVAGAFNQDGDIRAHTTGTGSGYEFAYDAGTNTYTAHGSGQPGGTVDDIVINEYVADPNTTFSQEWVELYNPTGGDVDVSGLWVDDIAGGGGTPKQVPGGTVIPAGGHWVMTWGGGFLNNGGDDVRLLSVDQATVIDAHTFTTSADDHSMHRSGDGGTWCAELSAEPTQGAANPTTCTGDPAPPPPGTVADVVINEFVADPNTTFTQEWVELYNPTGDDLDISGLWVDDIADAGSAPKQIPDGTVIPAGGHWVMTWGGGFLNNGGDDVRLLSVDQAAVYDAVTYTSSADDQSLHRMGDGGDWCAGLSTNATQGTANPTTCD